MRIFDPITPTIQPRILEAAVVTDAGFVFPPASAHYKMDELSGNIVNSGDGTHGWGNGTAVGTPVYDDAGLYSTQPGIFLDDGSQDGFDLPGVFAGGSMSMGCLFYNAAIPNSASLWGNKGTTKTAGNRYIIVHITIGIFGIVIDDAGTQWDVRQNAVNANTSTSHAHMELDVAGNELRLYINGALHTTTDITGHGGFDTEIADGRASIGYNRQAPPNTYVDAILADVYYMDYVTTADQRNSIVENCDGIGNWTDLVFRITGDTYSKGPVAFVVTHKTKIMNNGSIMTYDVAALIKEGYALDGSGDFIEMIVGNFPASMANWAFSSIIKTSATKALNCLWATNSGEYAFYVEQSGGDDLLTFYRKTGDISYSVNLGVNALTDGVVHQVGFDCNGSTLEFYLDGASVGSVSCSETIVPATNARGGDTFTAAEDGDYTYVEEMRLYEATLGATKMKLMTALAAT